MILFTQTAREYPAYDHEKGSYSGVADWLEGRLVVRDNNTKDMGMTDCTPDRAPAVDDFNRSTV